MTFPSVADRLPHSPPDPDRAMVERMPRIALNGRFTGTARPTGTQTVAHEIVEHVTALEDRPEIVLFVDPAHPSVPRWRARAGVTMVEVPFAALGRTRAQLYEQFGMHRRARELGCDLVHHPMNGCPRWPGAVASLVTVHDLNFHHHPEWYGRAFRTWLEHTMIPGLRRAAQVVCISEYVAGDVLRTLGLDASRVSTIPNGLKQLVEPSKSSTIERADPPVILAVNPWQPHKNLVRLLRAVRRLREEGQPCAVAIAGRPHENFRGQPDLEDELAHEHVHVLGYLTDEDLARAYARASVLAMPSLEEGFGLPVIEAMAHGTSVVTSTVTSLPEVGGDAAAALPSTRT
jgi:glycosyltransferase involved in cell wall biosynthesis